MMPSPPPSLAVATRCSRPHSPPHSPPHSSSLFPPFQQCPPADPEAGCAPGFVSTCASGCVPDCSTERVFGCATCHESGPPNGGAACPPFPPLSPSLTCPLGLSVSHRKKGGRSRSRSGKRGTSRSTSTDTHNGRNRDSADATVANSVAQIADTVTPPNESSSPGLATPPLSAGSGSDSSALGSASPVTPPTPESPAAFAPRRPSSSFLPEHSPTTLSLSGPNDSFEVGFGFPFLLTSPPHFPDNLSFLPSAVPPPAPLAPPPPPIRFGLGLSTPKRTRGLLLPAPAADQFCSRCTAAVGCSACCPACPPSTREEASSPLFSSSPSSPSSPFCSSSGLLPAPFTPDSCPSLPPRRRTIRPVPCRVVTQTEDVLLHAPATPTPPQNKGSLESNRSPSKSSTALATSTSPSSRATCSQSKKPLLNAIADAFLRTTVSFRHARAFSSKRNSTNKSEISKDNTKSDLVAQQHMQSPSSAAMSLLNPSHRSTLAVPGEECTDSSCRTCCPGEKIPLRRLSRGRQAGRSRGSRNALFTSSSIHTDLNSDSIEDPLPHHPFPKTPCILGSIQQYRHQLELQSCWAQVDPQSDDQILGLLKYLPRPLAERVRASLAFLNNSDNADANLDDSADADQTEKVFAEWKRQKREEMVRHLSTLYIHRYLPAPREHPDELRRYATAMARFMSGNTAPYPEETFESSSFPNAERDVDSADNDTETHVPSDNNASECGYDHSQCDSSSAESGIPTVSARELPFIIVMDAKTGSSSSAAFTLGLGGRPVSPSTRTTATATTTTTTSSILSSSKLSRLSAGSLFFRTHIPDGLVTPVFGHTPSLQWTRPGVPPPGSRWDRKVERTRPVVNRVFVSEDMFPSPPAAVVNVKESKEKEEEDVALGERGVRREGVTSSLEKLRLLLQMQKDLEDLKMMRGGRNRRPRNRGDGASNVRHAPPECEAIEDELVEAPTTGSSGAESSTSAASPSPIPISNPVSVPGPASGSVSIPIPKASSSRARRMARSEVVGK